jgi:Cellulase (glycosyl hydrolase family 5)
MKKKYSILVFAIVAVSLAVIGLIQIFGSTSNSSYSKTSLPKSSLSSQLTTQFSSQNSSKLIDKSSVLNVDNSLVVTNPLLDSPIEPPKYQQLLGKGVNVIWAEFKSGVSTYNPTMVKDFKEAGVSHIRIRVKDDADSDTIKQTERVVQDCLANGLIPVIAYHGGLFEEQPTLENLQKSVDWWTTVSSYFKDYSHQLSFDLIIEVTDALNKDKDILNTFYEKAVTSIRATNPTRIIFISPVVRSSPENLQFLNIPTQANGYLMAEWHFYAAGPDKVNTLKKWATGTQTEKDLVSDKIKIAMDWQQKTGIYTWVGAWMPGNYNKGDNYTPQEQIGFANFMTCELTKNKIPFAINSDNKFYDPAINQWRPDLKPVLDEIIKTNC